MNELLGLIADINPAEIASQIERDNLANWCKLWRQEATVAAIDSPPVLAKTLKAVVQEYEKAQQQKHIRNPLAYALYQVWNKVDQK